MNTAQCRLEQNAISLALAACSLRSAHPDGVSQPILSSEMHRHSSILLPSQTLRRQPFPPDMAGTRPAKVAVTSQHHSTSASLSSPGAPLDYPHVSVGVGVGPSEHGPVMTLPSGR